jgi:hypothetical protein
VQNKLIKSAGNTITAIPFFFIGGDGIKSPSSVGFSAIRHTRLLDLVGLNHLSAYCSE